MTVTDADHKSLSLPLLEHAHVMVCCACEAVILSSTYRQLACAQIEVDAVDAADATCDGDIACRQEQAELATNRVPQCHDTLLQPRGTPAAACQVRQASESICCVIVSQCRVSGDIQRRRHHLNEPFPTILIWAMHSCCRCAQGAAQNQKSMFISGVKQSHMADACLATSYNRVGLLCAQQLTPGVALPYIFVAATGTGGHQGTHTRQIGFACSSSLLVLRSQTLLTPARSTVTLVLVPNRKTLPVPEARTVALAMVPLKTVCPVLQGQAFKVEVLVLLFWTTESPACYGWACL